MIEFTKQEFDIIQKIKQILYAIKIKSLKLSEKYIHLIIENKIIIEVDEIFKNQDILNKIKIHIIKYSEIYDIEEDNSTYDQILKLIDENNSLKDKFML